MIKLKLDEMLEKRGMSAYGLHKASGKKLHQSVISKIKNNDSKALQLDTLDLICEILQCQPADLIIYESENTTQNVPRATQTAKHTQNTKHTQSVNTTQIASNNEKLIDGLPPIDDSDRWLTTKQIAEYTNRKPRTVSDFYKQGLLRKKTTKGSFVKLSDLTEFLKNQR